MNIFMRVVFSACLAWNIFFSQNSLARFLTESEANFEVLNFDRLLEIKKDGTYAETVEVRVKVLNDTGRDNYATTPLYYDEYNQKLEVLSAKSVDGAEEFPVESEYIEDKPVASSQNGLSSLRQVLISFPRNSRGVELYLKYRVREVKASISGNFANHFVWGQWGLWRKSHIKVVSEIPFFDAIHDSNQILEVKRIQDGSKQILEATQLRPIIKEIVGEASPTLDNKVYTWIRVTSFSDWKSLIQKFAPGYERVLAQPLPEFFAPIIAEASSKKNLFDKINSVTSALIDRVHYMGDWRTTFSKVEPRDLAEIAEKRRGDCKDFSTATVAILRKMGINASPALVRRGFDHLRPLDLPDPTFFNHAIVRVEDEGKVYWVDPTNSISFAQGIFPDIADRRALALNSQFSSPEMTSKTKPGDGTVISQERIKISKDGRAQVVGKLIETGGAALGLTGAGLVTSRENTDFQIVSFVGDVNRMEYWKLADYDLSSRDVKDLEINYQYGSLHQQMKTNSGRVVVLPSVIMGNPFLVRVEDRESDIRIGDQPYTYKKQSIFENVKLLGTQSLDCRIRSKWLDASRRVLQKKTGVEVSDEFEVKTPLVPNAELKTPEFREAQDKIRECFGSAGLILSSSS